VKTVVNRFLLDTDLAENVGGMADIQNLCEFFGR